ncbi:MAG: hypothetical protein IJ965_06705 [Campylobacter sp.]|nr:hypothetical protein [Campylobacter sp.]MBR2163277.1 hypothetical protein [Campylobacter sp.]
MLQQMMMKFDQMLDESENNLPMELEIHKMMMSYFKMKLAEAQAKSDIQMINLIQELIDFQAKMIKMTKEEIELLK